MKKEEQTVTITKEELKELLERAENNSSVDSFSEVEFLNKKFWISVSTKIVAMFFSVKIWTLVLMICIPYQLLVKGLITGDNYATILVVTAPLVLGMREFSKRTQTQENSGLADSIKGWLSL